MTIYRYKTYLFALLFGAIIGPTIALIGIYVSLDDRIEAGRWVSECLEKKAKLAAISQPHVVLLSGSNTLFGLSAQQMSQQFKVNSVNAAVHAGLGLEYILYQGRRYLAPNITYVLPLEYELYGGADRAQAYQFQIVGYDPDYFRAMSWYQKLEFSVLESPMDRIRLLMAKIKPDQRSDGLLYNVETLNDWGDETSNKIEAQTPAMVMAAHKVRAKRYDHSDEAWLTIARFVKEVRESGGDVVLAYPTIYFGVLDIEANKGFFGELQSRARGLNLKLVGRPSDHVFQDNVVFDTIYHQTSAGREVNTAQLHDDLVKANVLK